ncbi:MAG TPA: hypothetical protein DDZ90_17035 [Planctomycetaceae bacterium]|nr:hypothetical protein [Planctomycetaceae bacterium]
MLKLFLTMVFCCASSSLFAEDVPQSIYAMDSFETPVLNSVVEPLTPVPEQQVAETTRARTELDASLLFQVESSPLLPFYESYDASQFYDRMRYWSGGLDCIIPRERKTNTKHAASDGAFTVSKKLEEVWERLKTDYQETEEKYRLLNLYHGARHR